MQKRTVYQQVNFKPEFMIRIKMPPSLHWKSKVKFFSHTSFLYYEVKKWNHFPKSVQASTFTCSQNYEWKDILQCFQFIALVLYREINFYLGNCIFKRLTLRLVQTLSINLSLLCFAFIILHSGHDLYTMIEHFWPSGERHAFKKCLN